MREGRFERTATETCLLPYVKQMTSASSKHEAGHSKPVLWDNPKGRDGDGGGRGSGGGDTCTHGRIMSMCGKTPQYY